MVENQTSDSFYIELIKSKVLTTPELMLYMHLCNSYENAIEKGELYTPRQEELAIVLDCHQPQVSSRMAKLHEVGLIDYRKSSSKSCKSCTIMRHDLVRNTLVH